MFQRTPKDNLPLAGSKRKNRIAALKRRRMIIAVALVMVMLVTMVPALSLADVTGGAITSGAIDEPVAAGEATEAAIDGEAVTEEAVGAPDGSASGEGAEPAE